MKKVIDVSAIFINGVAVEKRDEGRFFITAFSQGDNDRVFWQKSLHDYSTERESDHQIGNGCDVSRMLYELEMEHDITVGGISCDMWMGILLKHADYELTIECDNAEYGFLCGILFAREIDKK